MLLARGIVSIDRIVAAPRVEIRRAGGEGQIIRAQAGADGWALRIGLRLVQPGQGLPTHAVQAKGDAGVGRGADGCVAEPVELHVVDEDAAVIHHVADRAVLITQVSEDMAGAVFLREDLVDHSAVKAKLQDARRGVLAGVRVVWAQPAWVAPTEMLGAYKTKLNHVCATSARCIGCTIAGGVSHRRRHFSLNNALTICAGPSWPTERRDSREGIDSTCLRG